MIFAILLAIMLSARESSMISRVAKEYNLNHDQTILLTAIRIHENGKPSIEFGVGHGVKNHPAMRYKDGTKSFLTQARWAAGTIKKRYTGDLTRFAKRYCPDDPKVWERDVRKIIMQLDKGK